MSRPVARASFLLSSITLALLFVTLMVGGLGRMVVVAEETGRTPTLTSGTLTPRAPFTFTALHNDFYLGGGQIIAVTDLNGDDYPDLVRSGVFSDQTSIWFNDGAGNFYDSKQYIAGFLVTAVGDIDFDTTVDLVGTFADGQGGNPYFLSLINDGKGHFREFPAYWYFRYWDWPFRLNLGKTQFLQANDDSWPDLLIQKHDSLSADLLLNDGTWGEYHPTSTWPYAAVPVDINGDGRDDAWVSHDASPSRLWLNNGSGDVTLLAQPLPAGNHFTAADFNGDTFTDLYIHDTLNGQIAFGNGTGVFTTNGQLISGLQMGLADHGDFDGDGDQDLAIPNTDLGEITIWENDGSGLLTATLSLPAGPASQVIVADLDLNDRDDIIVALLEGETGQTIWLNNQPTVPPAGLQLAATGPQTGENCIWHFSSLTNGSDLDTTWRFADDGSASGATARHCYAATGSQQAWFTATNPLGTITDTIVYTISANPSASAQLDISGSLRLFQPIEISVVAHTGHLGPLDYGDGHTGWSPTARYSHVYSQPGTYEISLTLLPPGAITPTFVTKTVTINPLFLADAEDLELEFCCAINTVQIHPGDFDNDGNVDLLVSGNIIGSYLWTNNGSGQFTSKKQLIETHVPAITDIGDVNGDGFLDIITTEIIAPSYEGQGKTFLNNGAGYFYTGQENIFVGEDASLIKLADFDGDGDLDAYVGYSTTNSLDEIFWNDGTGAFSDEDSTFPGNFTQDITVVDLNDDTFLDIVLARKSLGTQIWFNDGTGDFTQSPQLLTESFVVASGDLNGDGTPDLVTNATDFNKWFDVWLNDGAGQFTLAAAPSAALHRPATEGLSGIPYRADIALGDIDQDGDLDLLSTDISGMWVYLTNDGAGRLSLTAYQDTRPASNIALADLDSDDDLDFVLGIVVFDPRYWPESDYPVQPIWFNNNALEPISNVVISNTGPVNAHQSFHLLASLGSGNNVDVQWNLGNTRTDTRLNPDIDYGRQGVFSVVLTLTNALNTVRQEMTVLITETTYTTPVLSHSAYAPARVAVPFELDEVRASGTAIEYGDGHTGFLYRDQLTIFHVYSQTGVYTVTVHGRRWEISRTTRITISDHTLWGIDIMAEQPIQLNHPATFTAFLAYGQPTSYTWDMGDGVIHHGAIITHTYANTGAYTVTLTVADQFTALQATVQIHVVTPALYLPILVAAPP